MDYDFQWYLITRNWQGFVDGIMVTYQVTIFAMAIALTLGLILALMKLSGQPVLSLLAQGYIEFGRAMPLYVFLLWIYFGLSLAIDIVFQPLQAGVISLGLITAAYMAEIYRSGIEAVNRGQYEAARALGLTPVQIYKDVILPQAFRVIIPAAGNQFVGAFKGATIVAVIGVADVIYFAREMSLETFKPFEFYSTAGVMLIASTLAFSGLVSILESRMRWGQ